MRWGSKPAPDTSLQQQLYGMAVSQAQMSAARAEIEVQGELYWLEKVYEWNGIPKPDDVADMPEWLREAHERANQAIRNIHEGLGAHIETLRKVYLP